MVDDMVVVVVWWWWWDGMWAWTSMSDVKQQLTWAEASFDAAEIAGLSYTHYAATTTNA